MGSKLKELNPPAVTVEESGDTIRKPRNLKIEIPNYECSWLEKRRRVGHREVDVSPDTSMLTGSYNCRLGLQPKQRKSLIVSG